MKAFIPAALSLLALGMSPCFGQIIPSMTGSSMRMNPSGEYEVRATYKLEPGPAPCFLGTPYSAQQVFQKFQILQDGTTILQDGAEPIPYYQDSAGRLRVDYPFRKPKNSPRSISFPAQIEIMDPVAGYHYILDPIHRVAHRGTMQFHPIKYPRSTPATLQDSLRKAGPANDPSGSPKPEISLESLGSRVIDGLTVEGQRMTIKYPAGSVGNDRPITTTQESWYSPELPFPVFRKTNDPRTGEEKMAYFNIKQSEPDTGLFQVPKGYQIVDEPGPFAITFTLR
jgi:hypothetical protein